MLTSDKVGFCFGSTDAIDLARPAARWNPPFATDGCASGRPNARAVRMSVQVGWGDQYDQTLPGQTLDVTDLPNGSYGLEIVVDPRRRLVQASRANDRVVRPILLGGQPRRSHGDGRGVEGRRHGGRAARGAGDERHPHVLLRAAGRVRRRSRIVRGFGGASTPLTASTRDAVRACFRTPATRRPSGSTATPEPAVARREVARATTSAPEPSRRRRTSAARMVSVQTRRQAFGQVYRARSASAAAPRRRGSVSV